MAEPHLERNLHPTVVIRGYLKALEDAIKIIDEIAFPIDINDRQQMLNIVNSCIGTKFTQRFGSLIAVRALALWRGNGARFWWREGWVGPPGRERWLCGGSFRPSPRLL